ncbi:MAG TPA: hypothetical protein VFV32_05090 [Acidimicrobiales bacterium]|nr:hypothetical protein [Acidimicrobiales bacterium]
MADLSCRRGPLRCWSAVAPGYCPWALLAWVVVGLVVLVGACSSDGGDDGADLAPSGTGAIAAPAVPNVPPASAAGTGTIVVGPTTGTFEVTECRLDPDPSQPEAARALLVAKGAGTTARGDAYTVEVQRFATTLDDVVTYTDTIAYTDAARILQAQRIEVGGQVTDLRDPDASSSLLRPRSGGVSGAGLAGAPGDGADDGGIVGLALDLACP